MIIKSNNSAGGGSVYAGRSNSLGKKEVARFRVATKGDWITEEKHSQLSL